MAIITKLLTLLLLIKIAMSAPFTTFYNTPFGDQYVTQEVGPDGSYIFQTSGPGFVSTSFTSGY